MWTSFELDILIIEDNALLALDLEQTVEQLGHTFVGCAANTIEAMELIESRHVDVALIDLNLTDGASGAALGRLLVKDYGVAVMFLTGNPGQLPDDFCGVIGVLPKPCSSLHIAAVIDCAFGLRQALAQRPEGVFLPPCQVGMGGLRSVFHPGATFPYPRALKQNLVVLSVSRQLVSEWARLAQTHAGFRP